MSSALFAYPKKAALNRVLPKSKIYEYAKPTRAVQRLFVDEVEQIVWQYKLAPETINLPSRPDVPEIQIFTIVLKSAELSEVVLRTIDKAIPSPIFFEIITGDRIKSTATYKRPSEADSSKWVVDAYFETPWQKTSTPREPIPVALNLAGLYQQMLQRHLLVPVRAGEPLKQHVERINAIRLRQRDCKKLENLLRQEKQFNRKVELNQQLRALTHELNSLLD